MQKYSQTNVLAWTLKQTPPVSRIACETHTFRLETTMYGDKTTTIFLSCS